MNGFSTLLSNILGVFIPISFYACVAGTICILFLFFISLRLTIFKKSLRKLALFFSIIWLLNIMGNIFILIFNPSGVNLNSKGNRVFKDVQAGTVLMSKHVPLGSKDFSVKVSQSKQDLQILIWDYAVEDGSYVQVLFNGSPITDPFQLKNSPQRVWVPRGGKLQIKGSKAGASSINYALQFPDTGDTYFNQVSLDGVNTYTITAN